MPKVAFIYDERFLEHKHPNGNEHPEIPLRVAAPYETLKERGVLEKLHLLKARAATIDELTKVHGKDFIEKFGKAKEANSEIFNEIDKVVLPLPDLHKIFEGENFYTYLNSATYETALLSAGSALELTEAVVNKSVDTGFALIRPPGHHADRCSISGFCFLNNVAVAAEFAKASGVGKIMIVDWDIHHGNGTQDAFYTRDDVLYLSLHRFNTFPGLDKGRADRVGEEKGKGYNINIAWHGEEIMGDGDYKHAFEEIVIPVAKKFAPELILVSCGFDAARGDRLEPYDVTIDAYAWMTSQLLNIGSKVAVFFEGGYNIDNLREGVYAVIMTLLGEKEVGEISTPPTEDGKKCVASCKDNIKPYWFSS